jgi:hypothetical protein
MSLTFFSLLFISAWPNYVNSDDAYFEIRFSQFQDPTISGANLAPASKVRVLESLKVIFSRT